ncbi:Xaa-Pro aminopeptidase [Phocoenobacter atlanticus]|uniref:Xaa-Pro aminopeptidase n=1 Tax=Phocoenobacter atlanticus TaxID=3416742 RepID=UPI002744DC0D|nr:Xaa-Pro aminopeptidase [Pasteurella atlantica]MDP8100908.1 Xaa-Pro aminopeptidase [Pasteurella atlantica]
MDLSYMAKMPQSEFTARRQRVFEQMQNNSALIVFTETEKRRNNDCEYLFRPDSYFWYLTGFAEPQSALLLIKQQGKMQSILFLREKDPLMETWNGRRLGTENAPQSLEIDEAYNIETINEIFAKKCDNVTACYYAEGLQTWGDKIVSTVFDNVISWETMLSEMRLIKSKLEIDLMQQACHISSMAHIRAMKTTRPNRYEMEIEGEIHYEFSRFGSRGPSYNSIVAGGDNACILHYNENDQVLQDGDLLLIDAGAEFAMYAGDITRTFPINGKFSQPQRELYQLVLEAQKSLIEQARAGISMQTLNEIYIEKLTTGLVELGILKGDVKTLIEQEAWQEFYMHGLGHSLGLDVHDVGKIGRDKRYRDRPLEVGMVFTIEPGVYIPKSASVPEQYKGIGIRIEDNIVITEYGCKNLTSSCPKEIEDIEMMMAEQI